MKLSFLRYGFLRAPEGEPGTGGGGGGGQTFDQDAVNGIVKRATEKLEQKIAALTEQAEKTATLEQQLQAMRVQLEDAGKTAEQKAQAESQRELDALRAQNEQLKAEVETHKTNHSALQKAVEDGELDRQLSQKIVESGCIPEHAAKAVRLLRMEKLTPEFRDGKLVNVIAEIDGKNYSGVGDVAKTFLEKNPYLKANTVAGAGGGSRSTPLGGEGLANANDDLMNPGGLIKSGLEKQPD